MKKFVLVAAVALVFLTNGCVFRGPRGSASFRSPRHSVHLRVR